MNTALDRDLSWGRSEFLRVRGLRYHLRHFGDPKLPLVFLLHGWLDLSGTWIEVAARLSSQAYVIAPDWRGFGYSQWAESGYWFQDYLADLDVIVHHYAPDDSVDLVGHSMGAQVASLYAGVRPAKVRRLVCLDGLMMPNDEPEKAPNHYLRWIDYQRRPMKHRAYDSFEQLAERVHASHPRLSPERADFIARCWGRLDVDGRVRLLADPRHRVPFPTLYRSSEAEAIWKQVTAPTLLLRAGESELKNAVSEEERSRRHACFARRSELTMEGVGHMLHFEAPDQTADIVGNFLTSAP